MFTILIRNYSNSKVLVITKSLKRQFYLCSLFTILIDSFIAYFVSNYTINNYHHKDSYIYKC